MSVGRRCFSLRHRVLTDTRRIKPPVQLYRVYFSWRAGCEAEYSPPSSAEFEITYTLPPPARVTLWCGVQLNMGEPYRHSCEADY